MSIDTSNLIDNSNLNDENSTISPYSDDTFMKIKSRLRSDSGKRQQQQQQQQQQHQQQQGRGSGLRFGGSSGLKLTSLSENLQANDNVNSNTEELLRKRNADDIIEEMDSTFISQQANVVGSKTPIKPLVSSPFKPSNSSFLNSVNANTSYRSSATTSTPASINKQHHEFSQLSNFPNMSKISSFNNNSNHNNHNNLTSNSPTRHDYNQSHISPLRYNTSNIGDISQIQNKSIFGKSTRSSPNKSFINNNNNVNSFLNVPSIKFTNQNNITTIDNDSEELQSPYMEIALSRITNKELELKKLLINFILSFIYKFTIAVLQVILISFDLRQERRQQLGSGSGGLNLYPSIDSYYSLILKYGHYINYFVYSIFLLNMILSIFKLITPQDKCLDLPLSDKQRKLLGLPIVSSSSSSSSSSSVSNRPVPSYVQSSTNNTNSYKPFASSPLKNSTKLSSNNNINTNNNNSSILRDSSFAGLDISRSFASMNIKNSPNRVTNQLNKNNNLNFDRSFMRSNNNNNNNNNFNESDTSAIIKERLLLNQKQKSQQQRSQLNSNLSFANSSFLNLNDTTTLGGINHNNNNNIYNNNSSFININRNKTFSPSSKYMFSVNSNNNNRSNNNFYNNDISFS